MPAFEFLLLIAAGLAAGLVGSVTGLASVISYPALLAAGLPPVAANVTNTVALVFSGIGSAIGGRPELTGQGHRLRTLGAAGVLGGAVGALLLLVTPAGAFSRVVPVLIGLASLCVLIPRRHSRPQRAGDTRPVVATVFAVSIYGGYFGAAAGVLMLALLLAATAESLPRSNAIKNAVLGLANGVAALGFLVLSDVRWLAVLPLAAGFFVGGRLGPSVVRRVPAEPLRWVIATAGVAIAIRLAVQAY